MFLKKRLLTQVFFCEFYKIFKNIFLYRTPLVAASVSECDLIRRSFLRQKFLMENFIFCGVHLLSCILWNSSFRKFDWGHAFFVTVAGLEHVFAYWVQKEPLPGITQNNCSEKFCKIHLKISAMGILIKN